MSVPKGLKHSYVGCECFSPFLGRVVSIKNVFLGATEVALLGFPKLPVEVGFLVDVQWIGSGGRRHAPPPAGAVGEGGVDGGTDLRHLRELEMLLHQGRGLAAGGDQRAASGQGVEQQGDIGRFEHFQQVIAGIVVQAVDADGGVVEGQPLLGGKLHDAFLVEALFARHLEVALVAPVNDAHDAPEVVDPVGIKELHAPLGTGRRKTAQEQYLGSLRQKGSQWVLLDGHKEGKRCFITLLGANIRILSHFSDYFCLF